MVEGREKLELNAVKDVTSIITGNGTTIWHRKPSIDRRKHSA